VLLIDEPGAFLHPQGQKDVLRELIALASRTRSFTRLIKLFSLTKTIQNLYALSSERKEAKVRTHMIPEFSIYMIPSIF